MQLVLASASPRRIQLLAQAGIPCRVHPSHIPEDDVPGLDPPSLAAHHARNKALAVAPYHPEAITLGADTIVVHEGEALGKPCDLDEAHRMLARLAGNTHTVITAVCMVRACDGKRHEFSASTSVTFLPLDDAAIASYLAKINPLDKAGAYAAQEHADLIIASVTGSFNNVVGLPVELLPEALAQFGSTPPEDLHAGQRAGRV